MLNRWGLRVVTSVNRYIQNKIKIKCNVKNSIPALKILVTQKWIHRRYLDKNRITCPGMAFLKETCIKKKEMNHLWTFSGWIWTDFSIRIKQEINVSNLESNPVLNLVSNAESRDLTTDATFYLANAPTCISRVLHCVT